MLAFVWFVNFRAGLKRTWNFPDDLWFLSGLDLVLKLIYHYKKNKNKIKENTSRRGKYIIIRVDGYALVIKRWGGAIKGTI